jgi:hypothetical protein
MENLSLTSQLNQQALLRRKRLTYAPFNFLFEFMHTLYAEGIECQEEGYFKEAYIKKIQFLKQKALDVEGHSRIVMMREILSVQLKELDKLENKIRIQIPTLLDEVVLRESIEPNYISSEDEPKKEERKRIFFKAAKMSQDLSQFDFPSLCAYLIANPCSDAKKHFERHEYEQVN